MADAQTQSTESGRRLDVGLTLLVCFLWATCAPLIHVAVEYAPPLKLAAWRALIAGLVIVIPVLLVSRRLPPRSAWLPLCVAGLGLTSLGFGGMFLAGGKISPGLATVLANSQPLIAVVLGLVFLQEKLGPARLIALMLGFTGVLTCSLDTLGGGSLHSTAAGVGFILLGALGVAGGNIALKRVSGRVSALSAAGFQLMIGAAPLFVLAYAAHDGGSIQFSWGFLLTLTALAIPGTAVAMTLWAALLKRRDLVQVNTLTFTTPVFGVLIGALVFGERLVMTEWAGVLLIIAAVVLISGTFRRVSPVMEAH